MGVEWTEDSGPFPGKDPPVSCTTSSSGSSPPLRAPAADGHQEGPGGLFLPHVRLSDRQCLLQSSPRLADVPPGLEGLRAPPAQRGFLPVPFMPSTSTSASGTASGGRGALQRGLLLHRHLPHAQRWVVREMWVCTVGVCDLGEGELAPLYSAPRETRAFPGHICLNVPPPPAWCMGFPALPRSTNHLASMCGEGPCFQGQALNLGGPGFKP